MRTVNSRYGLRSVRVEEASHPGLGRKRRRSLRLRALIRSQRSIPSTQDASWEDPRPRVEFDLKQLDSSDEDQCNLAEGGFNVMPGLRER